LAGFKSPQKHGVDKPEYNLASEILMILIPLISLGFLIICLIGVLISFQYFSHYQSLAQLERTHVANQRQRAQSALGYLVIFCFAAVISLVGILYPAAIGFTPEPVQPVATDPNSPGTFLTLLPGETPGTSVTEARPPSATSEPTTEPTPTRILPTATIGNTGGAGANVRSIPGLSGVIIEVLAEGTRVILLEETREVDGFNWQLIEMPDTQEGWVVTQFLLPEN
jgi:hypothetical protein